MFKSNYKQRIILGIGAAIILSASSCKGVKDVLQVQNPQEEFNENFLPAVQTESHLSLNYEDFYKDAFLLELIGEGLENNLNLKQLEQRIKQSEAAYNLSRKAWLPAVNGQFNNRSAFRPGNENFGDWSGGYQWDLNAGVQWEIDIWGKFNKLKNAQYAQLLQTEYAQNQLKNNLVAQIAQSYYQLVALRESLAITEATIENWEQTVETMKALKISGRVTEAAVTQSRAQLSTIQASVSDIKAGILANEQRINFLLGRPYQSIPTRNINFEEHLPIAEVGIPSNLLGQRPDLRIAMERYNETHYMTQAAKTYFLPALTLTGSLGFNATDLKDIFNPLALVANITGGLLQPIFQKGANKARLEIAKADQEAAILDLQSTYINAILEVEQLLYNYQQENEKITHRRAQLEDLNLSVEYTEELLESGFAIYTEVITAKQQLLQAELAVMNDYIKRQNLLIELFNAVGGGTEIEIAEQENK